ncbi:hypothetical protein CPB83DRAFT_851804 [Crepidotus variabilis]|uniref:Uncharacterized protein n=1 Tax=Crepidotus variabilis TaxID=179855 RepID=A0A9P6EJ96_9AGAR|nr:hypothetical protein CPB83DRAFT_851804 [Crepidotus variabilis]
MVLTFKLPSALTVTSMSLSHQGGSSQETALCAKGSFSFIALKVSCDRLVQLTLSNRIVWNYSGRPRIDQDDLT